MQETKDAVMPPSTNRGAIRNTGIDWSTWSKPGCKTELNSVLGEVFSHFRSQREKAVWGHGYRGHDLAVYGCCVWRGTDVLVDLPGRAMEYIRYHLKLSDDAVCRWFTERGFRSTRLDAALDTSEHSFNPYVALKSWFQDLTRSDAQEWNLRLSKLEKGKPIIPLDGKGMTTYIGSELTHRRMRIYDKVTEVLQKNGEILTDAAGNEIPHLTRIEMQYRDAAANRAAELISKKGLTIIPQLMAGYVTFLSHRDNRTSKRKRVARWWLRIVGKDREPLQLMRGTATPDDSIAWIKRQALITLKMIKEKAPDVWENLMSKQIEDAEPNHLTRQKWKVWATARDERKKQQADFDQYERDQRVLAEIRRVWPERCGKEVY